MLSVALELEPLMLLLPLLLLLLHHLLVRSATNMSLILPGIDEFNRSAMSTWRHILLDLLAEYYL
jgi:hypothetical protein